MFLRVLNYAQHLIAERVKSGDTVVDATCGNGNDTIFLANLVGPNGKVFGFDIQVEAISATNKKVEENNFTSSVECINDSHENILSYVTKPIAAAMFNLGYLPGSDKEVITKSSSTVKALKAIFDLLSVGGIVTLVVYTEHDKCQEAQSIEDYLQTLSQKNYQVLKYGFINQIHYPPYLIAIEKLK